MCAYLGEVILIINNLTANDKTAPIVLFQARDENDALTNPARDKTTDIHYKFIILALYVYFYIFLAWIRIIFFF